ncbi:MAG: tetratricopeptide repeat protein [Planctomycetota bacterium]
MLHIHPIGRAPVSAAASLLLLLFTGCEQQAAKPQTAMPVVAAEAKVEPTPPSAASSSNQKPFAGSKTCYDCHAKFYEIWSTSRHGLAMQPYSPAFAKKHLKPQVGEVVIGKQSFRAEIGEKQGWVREKDGDKETRYPIAHVMGGKNTYYFLTQLPKGRLQVLPVAYEVNKQTWYDTAASGVRHFPDRRQRDEALPWTDRLFTFNTTCFDCHVSQLATNYDLETDTYRTTWREAGISCESCHGPGGQHIQAMEAGVKGHASQDIKIIRTLEFSHSQMNDMCATCHAKLVPLSTEFIAGEKFYDHYDLITLEHQDFYPDGRDLGENYTFTSWSMSPCLKSNKLDCNHCHTPSGRPRFEGKQANQSCLPCHARIVENPTAHSHHKAESTGNSCIACHMPMSRFAAMARTDHSMRSPTPAATIAYKSPNACNPCHTDHDAAWSDQWVRKWYPRDYQAEPLRRAALLDAARKNQWQRLPEMLTDVQGKQGDEIYRNSLVRLLRNCSDPKKWPVLIAALKDDSPLVRASVAAALDGYLGDEGVWALLRATADPVRLVRIRAAAALAAVRPERIDNADARKSLRRATDEFKKAMQARPDDWASHSNLGNYFMESGDYDAAVAAFEKALKLEPRVVAPMVNLSMAYANLKQNDKAESWLRRALKAEPDSAAANFNLGLLLAETNRLDEAQDALRAALKSDPQLASAAYNLAVILGAKKDLAGAVQWCRKAHDVRPEELKYTHSLAFYLNENGDKDEAIAVLKKAIKENPSFLDGCEMLAGIHEGRGDRKAAAQVLRDTMKQPNFPPQLRRAWQARAEGMETK